MSGYFGSKATSGLCQPLIAMMPPHDTYIETHLGGGAIMKRKPPAQHNIGIDLDARALAGFGLELPALRLEFVALGLGVELAVVGGHSLAEPGGEAGEG